jgi:hypothetical protein
MRRNQGLLLGLGCLVALAGACDDGAVMTPPQTTAGTSATAGTPAGTAGTTGTSGTGMAAAGTGTMTGTSGTGASGTTGGAGTSAGTGTAGMSTAGTGSSAGTSGGTAGAPPSGTAGFAMCGGAPKEGVCKTKAPGIYAMKTEVDVWYMDEINTTQPLFDAHRGKLTIYFRGTFSDVCEDGSGGKGIMHPCGTRLPPLYASLTAGIIQIEFPDDLWEKPGVPDYTTTGSATGFGAGDTLKIAKTGGLLGIDLMNIDAAWPAYTDTTKFPCKDGKTGEGCFPDMDGDQKPGVTVTIKTEGTPPNPGYAAGLGEWHYIPAPTDFGTAVLGDGATKVFIGLRTRLGGSGMIGADCMSGIGPAEAEDFESRAIACEMLDKSPCTPAGAEFVDQNNPIFHVLQKDQTPPASWASIANAAVDRTPSKGPLSSVVRLGDLGATVSCADVRNAAFPPFN